MGIQTFNGKLCSSPEITYQRDRGRRGKEREKERVWSWVKLELRNRFSGFLTLPEYLAINIHWKKSHAIASSVPSQKWKLISKCHVKKRGLAAWIRRRIYFNCIKDKIANLEPLVEGKMIVRRISRTDKY